MTPNPVLHHVTLKTTRPQDPDAAALHRSSFAGEFDPDTPLDLRMPPR